MKFYNILKISWKFQSHFTFELTYFPRKALKGLYECHAFSYCWQYMKPHLSSFFMPMRKEGLSLLWGLGVPHTSPKLLFLEHTTEIPRLQWFGLLWSCQQVTRSFPSQGLEITLKSLQVRGPMAAGYVDLGVRVLPYQTRWTKVEKTIHPRYYTLIQICYITSSYQKDIYSESMSALRNRVLLAVLLLLFKDKLTTKLLW